VVHLMISWYLATTRECTPSSMMCLSSGQWRLAEGFSMLMIQRTLNHFTTTMALTELGA
jgi:hypothetical protein